MKTRSLNFKILGFNKRLKRKFPMNKKLNWLKIFYYENSMSIKVNINVLKQKIHIDF